MGTKESVPSSDGRALPQYMEHISLFPMNNFFKSLAIWASVFLASQSNDKMTSLGPSSFKKKKRQTGKGRNVLGLPF